MAACIGREGDCMERMELKQPAEVFSLGDWVRVPVAEMGNFSFVAGPVIYVNSRFFVIKSAVGGFTTSFTWTEVTINPCAFRKIGILEANRLLGKRLNGREMLV